MYLPRGWPFAAELAGNETKYIRSYTLGSAGRYHVRCGIPESGELSSCVTRHAPLQVGGARWRGPGFDLHQENPGSASTKLNDGGKMGVSYKRFEALPVIDSQFQVC